MTSTKGQRITDNPVSVTKSEMSDPPAHQTYYFYYQYKTYVLIYATVPWGSFICSTDWKSIETVQNVAICTMTGDHYHTRQTNILDSLNTCSLINGSKSVAKMYFYRNAKSTHTQKNTFDKSAY